MALNWEYCECGCHGHEAGIRGTMFWIYSNLQGSFYLHQGHGFLSPRIGIYKTWEEADAKANEAFQAKAIPLMAELKKLMATSPVAEPQAKKATKSRFNRKSPV